MKTLPLLAAPLLAAPFLAAPLLAGFALAVLVVAAPLRAHAATPGRSIAMLVGANAPAPGRTPLQFALRDAALMADTLARTGRPHEIVEYPGAGHAFMNETRPDVYRPEAAADSWRRALAFLRTHLAGAR